LLEKSVMKNILERKKRRGVKKEEKDDD